MDALERCRAYVAKLPPAIEGQGGDRQTLLAALACHDFGLSEHDAMSVMRIYNDRCLPPWSESQLLAKLRSAARSARKPAGWRLEESGPQMKPSDGPEPWPDLRKPTRPELEEIGRLRHLPVGVLWTAARWDFLWTCDSFASRSIAGSHRAYGIKTGESVQMRRLDGAEWSFRNERREPAKTYNLAGRSVGWNLSPGTENVLLVEGVIGLLEGLAAIDLGHAERAAGPAWSILAAPSAMATIPPGSLERLRGRKVRICPDAGEPGMASALKWAGQLHQVAAGIDVFELPSPHKDLGGVVRHQPEILKSIFC